MSAAVGAAEAAEEALETEEESDILGVEMGLKVWRFVARLC
jgi:hypothetical protein